MTEHAVIKGDLNGQGCSIGIVVSRFNEYAGKEELEACLEELRALGVYDEDIKIFSVPGALEIPFVLNRMAATGDFDALIALGAVIRGETYHFEIVANTSAAEIARVSNEWDIPIANGILTTENDEQTKERTRMKGKDCARCAVEMARLYEYIIDQWSDLCEEPDFDEDFEDGDDDNAKRH